MCRTFLNRNLKDILKNGILGELWKIESGGTLEHFGRWGNQGDPAGGTVGGE